MLKCTDRIEIELKIRQVAIQIAYQYGNEGVNFFHSEFLSVAEEYANGCKAKEQNNAILLSQVTE
jgi:hypothetical protein